MDSSSTTQASYGNRGREQANCDSRFHPLDGNVMPRIPCTPGAFGAVNSMFTRLGTPGFRFSFPVC